MSDNQSNSNDNPLSTPIFKNPRHQSQWPEITTSNILSVPRRNHANILPLPRQETRRTSKPQARSNSSPHASQLSRTHSQRLTMDNLRQQFEEGRKNIAPQRPQQEEEEQEHDQYHDQDIIATYYNNQPPENASQPDLYDHKHPLHDFHDSHEPPLRRIQATPLSAFFVVPSSVCNWCPNEESTTIRPIAQYHHRISKNTSRYSTTDHSRNFTRLPFQAPAITHSLSWHHNSPV
eukprot:GHVP01027908.1.p2 GENE.GHVP01027908.1~~GHVP01027908.1.p2  ORF type:complete len:234 (+),score=21.20 GHVP01027908.1:425-1126(+)